ncbi:MAG: putative toxin-antitoxin system toxin component, PIN family [Patescibacteria group bacterium]
MRDTPRIVLDTNVWLSALVFGGKPRQIVELFARGLVSVVASEEILTEMRRSVARAFPDFMDDLARMEMLIAQDADMVELGSVTIGVCRDPDDNRILETAILGDCKYVVSGDEDLLALGGYEGIRILNPGDFLQLVFGSTR